MRRILGPFLALAGAVALGCCACPALAGHVQCGETITQNTSLDSDLIDCPADGLVIGADNVKLDLNGHVVDGNRNFEGTGIVNPSGYDLIEVTDGVIREFGNGLVMDGASNAALYNLSVTTNVYGLVLSTGEANHVRDVSAFRNLVYGVVLAGGTGNEVQRNFAHENGFGGITLIESHGNEITNNAVPRNRTGINLMGSDDNRVAGNAVFENRGSVSSFEGSAISIRDGDRNLVEKNSLSDNGGFFALSVFGAVPGIFPGSATGNTVRQNSMSGGSPVYGVLNWGASGTQLDHNVISDTLFGIGIFDSADFRASENSLSESEFGLALARADDGVLERNRTSGGLFGIYFAGGNDRNIIVRNTVRGSSRDGIRFHPSDQSSVANQLVGNLVQGSGDDGIAAPREGLTDWAPDLSLRGNTARDNGDDGIDVDSPSATFTGNIASHNGDLGIEAAEGATDGGGNRAFGNGNPLQCLNVDCK